MLSLCDRVDPVAQLLPRFIRRELCFAIESPHLAGEIA